jgi:hypothetical protein
MTVWLKTFRRGNTSSVRSSDDGERVGDTMKFFEPLSTHSDNTPKLTRFGEPMGKPNYETGDLITSYWGGSYEVTDVWEVIGEPEPATRVGWGWQTNVRLLKKLPTGEGVPLEALDVSTKSLQRRVRLRFDDDQAQRLRKAFAL